MSPRTRPRIPHFFGLLQLVIRIGGLGTAIAALVVLSKLATQYHDVKYYHNRKLAGAIAASALAVVAHLIEAVPLADPTRHVKRASIVFVSLFDVAVFAVGLYAIFEILLTNLDMADAPTGTLLPGGSLQHTALVLIVAIIAEVGVAFVLDCVVCCRYSKAHKESQLQGRQTKGGNVAQAPTAN